MMADYLTDRYWPKTYPYWPTDYWVEPGARVALPSYGVHVDWDMDGGFADAGEDISSYVKAATISGGRSADFQKFVVGTLELVLDNEDGRFSPENTSSPLSPNVKLYRPVRMKATYSGSIFPLFYGFITRYTLHPGKSTKECYVYAEDSFSWLQRDEIATKLYKSATITQLAGSLLDNVSFPSGSRMIDDVDDTVTYAGWRDTSTLAALDELVEACAGHHYIEPLLEGYTYHFENRYHWHIGTGHTVSVETWDDAFMGLDYDLNDSQIFNYVNARAQTRVLGERQTLWSLQSVPIYISAGSSLGYWANFSEYVDDVAVPAATLDYTANSASDGGGTDRTTEITVAATEYALTADLEVTNAHTAGVWLTKLKIRGKRVQENPVEGAISEDATSQATYKRRMLTVDNRMVDDIAAARGLAAYYLHWYKDARAQVGPILRRNEFPSQLRRKIGDRVTVVHGGLGMSKDFHIHSVQHRIDLAGLRHDTTYRVQESGPGTGYWFQLDVAGVGLDQGKLLW